MLLSKEIIPEDTYYANSEAGRVRRRFDAQYLHKLADTANKMLQAGLKIPAPFGHSRKAVPQTEIEFNAAQTANPYNNAGYWQYFDVVPNADNKPTLRGFVDVPGSADDPNSPYYKAMNTAKEVSLSVRDKFTDGLEREWDDALIHVALVNHAVVPNQKDFEEVPEGASIVNLSMIDNDDDDVDVSMLSSVRQALKDACLLEIPDSNDIKTFLRDLLVAALQLKATRPVDGQTLEPVPIYMSTGDDSMSVSLEAAQAVVATKAVNPTTKKPFTLEDFGFKQAPQGADLSALQSQLAEKDNKLQKAFTLVSALVGKLKKDTQNSIQARIDKLVSNGVITKEFADSNLTPKLTYELSALENGELNTHPLELTLSTLEQVAVRTPAVNERHDTFEGTIVVPPLGIEDANNDPKQLNEAIDEFLDYLN